MKKTIAAAFIAGLVYAGSASAHPADKCENEIERTGVAMATQLLTMSRLFDNKTLNPDSGSPEARDTRLRERLVQLRESIEQTKSAFRGE